MRRVIVAIALLATPVVAASCSNLPLAEPPPPIVTKAPGDIAHLAIHVFQYMSPAQTPEDDWDYHHMPGYTGDLRNQFQGQLQQAGFTVIVDRKTPADIVATIQSDMPYDKAGVATLVLTRHGQVLDRISVPVRLEGTPPKTVHLIGEAAVRLVEALERSPAIAAAAREVAAEKPAQIASATSPTSTGLTMAADACLPEPGLPPEPSPMAAECTFVHTTRCLPPSPVRSAWQPAPFVECPREIPFEGTDVLGQQTAKFSPRETRALRLGSACRATPQSGACCYVQFDTPICR